MGRAVSPFAAAVASTAKRRMRHPHPRANRRFQEIQPQPGILNVELEQQGVTRTRDDFLMRPLFSILADVHAPVLIACG